MTLCTMCASFLYQKAGSAKRTEAARVRLRNCVRQGPHIFHDMMTDLKCHCERRAAVHSFPSFHAKDSRMGSFIGVPSQRRRWRCGIASELREAMESSKIRRWPQCEASRRATVLERHRVRANNSRVMPANTRGAFGRRLYESSQKRRVNAARNQPWTATASRNTA